MLPPEKPNPVPARTITRCPLTNSLFCLRFQSCQDNVRAAAPACFLGSLRLMAGSTPKMSRFLDSALAKFATKTQWVQIPVFALPSGPRVQAAAPPLFAEARVSPAGVSAEAATKAVE